MSKRSIFLFGLFIVIVALFLGYRYWSNGVPEAPVFQDSAPQSPIRITLKPQLISTDQVSIDVTVSSIVEIPDLRFRIDTSPNLKPTNVPRSSFHLRPNQPVHVTMGVTGAPANKAELVVVYVFGTLYTGTGGNGAGFYLEPQNGKWQILSTNEYGRQHPAPTDENSIPVSPIPTTTPKSSLHRLSPTDTITVTGQWEYMDHAITSTGIITPGKLLPIRQAQLLIQQKDSSGSWSTITTTHTNVDGTYLVFIQVSPGTQLRTRVCTVGPDNDKLRIVNVNPLGLAGAKYCTNSPVLPAQPNTDFSSNAPPDSDAGGGPWNIYDDILDGYNYISSIAPTGADLTVVWAMDTTPFCRSCYIAAQSTIYLDGGSDFGTEWDDSVILHEMGHWVMDKYAQLPFYTASHGSCQEGTTTPVLEYPEGWATFYQSAARKNSPNPLLNDPTIAEQYIYVGGGIGSTRLVDDVDLEIITGTKPFLDSTTGRGGYCEWGVAATLWHVLDIHSFDGIFKAFRTPYSAPPDSLFSGTHTPYSLNEWWYGWTNTLGQRSGGSFGHEKTLLGIFNTRRVDVGVKFVSTWPSTPADLDSHLSFFPTGYVSWYSKGVTTTTPYAGLDQDVTTGNGPETTWVTSPYPGTYAYAVYDWTDNPDPSKTIAGTNAKVQVIDGDNPYYAVAYTVPPSGSGDWWNLATYATGPGGTGFYIPNTVQASRPGPFYEYGGGVNGWPAYKMSLLKGTNFTRNSPPGYYIYQNRDASGFHMRLRVIAPKNAPVTYTGAINASCGTLSNPSLLLGGSSDSYGLSGTDYMTFTLTTKGNAPDGLNWDFAGQGMLFESLDKNGQPARPNITLGSTPVGNLSTDVFYVVTAQNLGCPMVKTK